MVKSKRNKVVHLTQVKKKGKDHKTQQIESAAKLLSQYQRVFVMNISSVKSKDLMELRMCLKASGRMFAGKNTVVSQAIKHNQKESQSKKDFKDLESRLKGKNALIFTDKPVDEIVELINAENSELKSRLIGHADLSTPNKVIFEKF